MDPNTPRTLSTTVRLPLVRIYATITVTQGSDDSPSLIITPADIVNRAQNAELEWSQALKDYGFTPEI